MLNLFQHLSRHSGKSAGRIQNLDPGSRLRRGFSMKSEQARMTIGRSRNKFGMTDSSFHLPLRAIIVDAMDKLPYIKRGHHGGMDFREDNKVASPLFLYFYFAGVFIFFIVLILRLFQLTVVKGEYYRRIAEGNRSREVIIEAKRGTIIDRHGIVIVDNLPPDLNKTGSRLASARRYHEAETLGSLIGYRQIADEHDVKNDPCLAKIAPGDKVGKKGVEKRYECELRGRNGKKIVEVDASGKSIGTLSVIPSQDGATLQLALDSQLQKRAYEVIADEKMNVNHRRVAIVGLKPQTGEILILASYPSFSPQAFEDGNTEKVSSYLKDPLKPLFNRATEGTYPPGSVFKPVVAAGALEDKKIDEHTLIEDTGVIKAGPIEFGNWYFLQYGKTEGMVNIIKGIQRSNDIFFYRTGERLGDLGIKSWAEKFGYGKKTEFGLAEAEGIVPSKFWKEEVLKEQWYLGDTYNFSIGQGYLLVTPLQVAQATAVLANGGNLCKPQLLKGSSECKKLPLSKKTLQLIAEGMKAACKTGGSAWPLFNFKMKNAQGQMESVDMACKTGTAESHAVSKTPHAWFTIYAPSKNPEILLTVLVEEGGQGSDIASPIAREILRTYLERKE